MALNITPALNAAVAGAKDVPDLIAKVSAVDPALAAQFDGKALIASKTPIGVLLATGIAFVSTKYGLGWDAGTDALVSGAVLLAASYGMRWISSVPITGLLRKATAVAPAKS